MKKIFQCLLSHALRNVKTSQKNKLGTVEAEASRDQADCRATFLREVTTVPSIDNFSSVMCSVMLRDLKFYYCAAINGPTSPY